MSLRLSNSVTAVQRMIRELHSISDEVPVTDEHIDEATKILSKATGDEVLAEAVQNFLKNIARPTYDKLPDDVSGGSAVIFVEMRKARDEGKKEARDDGKKEEKKVSKSEKTEAPAIDPGIAGAINTLLKSASAGAYEDINTLISKLDELGLQVKKEQAARAEAERRAAKAGTAAPKKPIVEGELTLKVVPKKAMDIFVGPSGEKSKMLDFDVNSYVWTNKSGDEVEHPETPEIDSAYVFTPGKLAAFLWAISAGRSPWLHGHTSTGKTTFIEQIAARLNIPTRRINFDSDMSRMDIIGREVLTTDPTSGATISKFINGILPDTLPRPFWLICDEVDFIRPDIAYVLQRTLEGKGLLVAEDGGRVVEANPLFRICATANTKGHGDEFGLYAGARHQSQAFISRWSPFIEVEYLTQKQEEMLLNKKTPGLDPTLATQLSQFSYESRQAFKKADVLSVVSPRDLLSCAEMCVAFLSLIPHKGDAIKFSMENTIFNKVSEQDAIVLKGVADRTINYR